jgi:hypothetical protein
MACNSLYVFSDSSIAPEVRCILSASLLVYLLGLAEALQQELLIPRSPSPDLVIGPLNLRNENNANASLSKEERLAQLKVNSRTYSFPPPC